LRKLGRSNESESPRSHQRSIRCTDELIRLEGTGAVLGKVLSVRFSHSDGLSEASARGVQAVEMSSAAMPRERQARQPAQDPSFRALNPRRALTCPGRIGGPQRSQERGPPAITRAVFAVASIDPRRLRCARRACGRPPYQGRYSDPGQELRVGVIWWALLP
jgi:hypothetical protein